MNKNEYIDNLKNAASLGAPVKMRYAAALGLTPSAVLHNEFVENQVFDIANTWVPLSSSYTQSSRQDEGGRPKVDEDNLSPEGEKTRERGDNDPDNRDY